jgi:hypothetical protein
MERRTNMTVLLATFLGAREIAIHRLHLELILDVTDGISENSVRSLLSDPDFSTFVSDIDSIPDWNIVSRHIGIHDPELLKPVLIRFIHDNIEVINNM